MSTSPAGPVSEELELVHDAGLASQDLLRLAVDRRPSVRAAVARRSDCPVAALMSLGHDRDPEVLRALIANPRTPASVIRALADHRTPAIADAAVQRLRNSLR
ncbi:hypothetical protein [Demequina sp. NBRC 110053]|uniref:hypothetical protein n=1 Tax=Demequina sp. NBRC 110053 TaxID=1570342 RepID=UPI000A06039B|nr:hypothetical protein [Demequina sp. NBRC 110053]